MTPSRTFQRDYWVAWIASLVFFGAFYALLVPLPRYLTGLGLPDWEIGVILGAFGVASLVGRPLAGVATDRWGSRRVMLCGTGALALGALLVNSTASVPLLFGLRVLQASGYVAFTTASTALVAASVAPERRGHAMALFGSAANVAMTMTPAAVDALLPLLTVTGAFWLTGGLALCGGALATQVRRAPPQEQQSFAWRKLWVIPPILRLPMLSAGLGGAAFGAFFQFVPLLVERRGGIAAGALYTVYGIGIILTRLATGRLQDRGETGAVLQVSFLLVAAGLAIFAFAHWWGLLAAALLVAAGSGIMHPSLIALHVALLPLEQRGRAVAVFYLGFDLGLGLGAWLLALVLQWSGLAAMYLLASGVALAGALLGRSMMRATRQVQQTGEAAVEA